MSECKQGCEKSFTKVTLGDRDLCYRENPPGVKKEPPESHLKYKDHEYFKEAALWCSGYHNSWLLVPKNAKENSDFKTLLSQLELGSDKGAWLGLKKVNDKFLDSNGELNWRKRNELFVILQYKIEVNHRDSL